MAPGAEPEVQVGAHGVCSGDPELSAGDREREMGWGQQKPGSPGSRPPCGGVKLIPPGTPRECKSPLRAVPPGGEGVGVFTHRLLLYRPPRASGLVFPTTEEPAGKGMGVLATESGVTCTEAGRDGIWAEHPQGLPLPKSSEAE